MESGKQTLDRLEKERLQLDRQLLEINMKIVSNERESLKVWSQRYHVYWTIHCVANPFDRRFPSYEYEKGYFSTQEKALNYLKKTLNGKNTFDLPRHYVTCSIIPKPMTKDLSSLSMIQIHMDHEPWELKSNL